MTLVLLLGGGAAEGAIASRARFAVAKVVGSGAGALSWVVGLGLTCAAGTTACHALLTFDFLSLVYVLFEAFVVHVEITHWFFFGSVGRTLESRDELLVIHL